MKLSNSKENIKPDEIAVTQGTTSTNFTKPTKPLFLQTISSNFSNQSKVNKIISRNKNTLEKIDKPLKTFSPLKTVENIHKHSNTLDRPRKSIEILGLDNIKKQIKSKLIQNLLLPRNINSYTHLIRGKGVGIYAEIDWALRLRDYSNKLDETKVLDYKDYYYRKNQKQEKTEKIKQEKIQLTENFSPPDFYEDDLKKYKNKIKNSEKSLTIKLNPNFYNIKHLLFRNKGDHSNQSQFHFATTLRNIKTLKENDSKNSKIKKFEVLPIVDKNNNNNYIVSKFLSPCTNQGIQNLKKVEKFMSKNHEYKIEYAWINGEKIKKRIYTENNEYTISGIGETLGDIKYDNYFRNNNIFANKKILETEPNPMCKFEIGLRFYGNDDDKKNKTHRNFKPKKKINNVV